MNGSMDESHCDLREKTPCAPRLNLLNDPL